MTNVAKAFQNADGEMLRDLVSCLDFMNNLPFFRTYKAQTWASLGVEKGQKILDVACGTGFDIIEMAQQFPDTEFCGVDISAGFLEIAEERAQHLKNVKFLQGNANELPLPADEFDGVRIDRALQHIEDPSSAIAEMTRVARNKGRVVATEPDWGTLVLYNGENEVSDKLTDHWKTSFRHPFIGRQLGQMFAERGVANLKCNLHALWATDFESAVKVFDLARLRDRCVEAGVLTAKEVGDWWRASEAASRRGSFLASSNLVEFGGVVVK